MPHYSQCTVPVNGAIANRLRVNRLALKAFDKTGLVDEKKMPGNRKRLCATRVPSSKRSRLEPLIARIGCLVENYNGRSEPTSTMTLVATETRFCGKKIDQEMLEMIRSNATTDVAEQYMDPGPSGEQPPVPGPSGEQPPLPEPTTSGSGDGDDVEDDNNSGDEREDDGGGAVYPEDITDFEFGI